MISTQAAAASSGAGAKFNLQAGKYGASLPKGPLIQLFGGYGFMDEYPISRDLADAAVQSIYAGSNEIMKVIIAKRMGLG